MPHSKDKAHTIQRLETERRRLAANLTRLSPEEMLVPGVVQHWSVKDVLAHLYDWEARFPVWLEGARQGLPAACPDPEFTWRQIHALNARIYELHRHQPLGSVLEAFHSTHQVFMQAVETLTEDELFTPAFFARSAACRAVRCANCRAISASSSR